MGHINFVKNPLLPVAELRKKIVKQDKNKQTRMLGTEVEAMTFLLRIRLLFH